MSSTLTMLESAEDIDFFPVYSDSRQYSSKLASGLVEFASRRLAETGAMPFVVHTESMKHSELALGERLGQGAFSSVFDIATLRSKSSKSPAPSRFVVKVLEPRATKSPKTFATCAADLVKEGIILSNLDHMNVVSVRALACDGIKAYENGRHDAFFIVMERLETTLDERLEEWKAQKRKIQIFPSSKKALVKRNLIKTKSDIILELADGIQYIHSCDIMHRDLKPENIGFDADGTLKLFDFDISRALPESQIPDETFLLTKRVGSPRYMSPEVALGQEYNAKVDVYAFGLLCYEILSLEKPFESVPFDRHTKEVVMGGARPTVPSSWTEELKAVVESCWSAKITARPTMAEAKQVLIHELPRFLDQKQKSTSKPWFAIRGKQKAIPQ